MKSFLEIFLIVTISTACLEVIASDWLCHEEASQRQGDEILACGIGIGPDENSARIQALDNASLEFNKLCNVSDDCRGKKVAATPKRTQCSQDGKTFKCYRLVSFAVSAETRDSHPNSKSDRKRETASTANPSRKAHSGNGVPRSVSLNFDKCFEKKREGYSWSSTPSSYSGFRMECAIIQIRPEEVVGTVNRPSYPYSCKLVPTDGSPIEVVELEWSRGYRAPKLTWPEGTPKIGRAHV